MVELATLTTRDYSELSAYLSSFYSQREGNAFWEGKFFPLWDNNPAFSDATERGWVLRDNGRIVGFLGSVPTYFQLFSRQVTVFGACTWRVLPEYRNKSMSLLLRLVDSAKGSLVFCCEPNPAARQILESLRFQVVPRETERRAAIILNFQRILESPMRRDVLINSFGRRFSFVIRKMRKMRHKMLEAGVLGAVQNLRLRKLSAGVLGVKQLSRADSSFDRLWERTKTRYVNTNVRTAEVINWLCFSDQDPVRGLFACYQGDELLAFMICRARNPYGLKMLECLDLWGETEQETAVKSLVNATRRYAQTNGYDLVTYPFFTHGNGLYLKKLGLCELREPERRHYFKIESEYSNRLSGESSYFAFHSGDSVFF